MKTLLALSLFISVGAWGQITYPTIQEWKCKHGDTIIYDPIRSPTCYHPKSADYVDVPAIQESVLIRKKGDYWGCGMNACIADHDMYEKEWTCADKSRTLLETLDGKTHYCHKPQLSSP